MFMRIVLALSLVLVIAAYFVGGAAPVSAGNTSQSSQDTVQIIVKFKPSATSSGIAAAIKSAGGGKHRDLNQIRTRIITVPANAVDKVMKTLAKRADVERVSGTVVMHEAGTPDDTLYTEQWALSKIGWDQVYGAVAINGSATVAILDTGIDAGHPEFAGLMADGQSFTGGDADSDPNGHGTAMAGIVAAKVNNQEGIAGVAYAWS